MKLNTREKCFSIPYKEFEYGIIADKGNCCVEFLIEKRLICKGAYTITFKYIPKIEYYWRRSSKKFEVMLCTVVLSLSEKNSSVKIDDKFEQFLIDNLKDYFSESVRATDDINVRKITNNIGTFDNIEDILQEEYVCNLMNNMGIYDNDKKIEYLKQLIVRPY